jgi:hypothetical protein
VIKGQFESAEGVEAERFSRGDFGFVQALDNVAGTQLLSTEMINYQVAVLTE